MHLLVNFLVANVCGLQCILVELGSGDHWGSVDVVVGKMNKSSMHSEELINKKCTFQKQWWIFYSCPSGRIALNVSRRWETSREPDAAIFYCDVQWSTGGQQETPSALLLPQMHTDWFWR